MIHALASDLVGDSDDWIAHFARLPEPDIYAMMFAGLSPVGFAVRRKERHVGQ